MLKKLFIAAVLFSLTLFTCCDHVKTGDTTVPSTSNAGSAWQECIYMQCENGPMVYVNGYGPGYLRGLTDEMKALLEPLKTGDILSITQATTEDLYPANIYPDDLCFVREGSEENIPQEVILRLREMGHPITLSHQPLNVPDFEIQLRWGAYGYSHYESASGELIKTTDATNPEDYRTVHMLTDEERETVWALLTEMNYSNYPEYYNPNPNMLSEPPDIISLMVTRDGESKGIRTRSASLVDIEDPAEKKKADIFIKNFGEIVHLLENTPEWQALPDYERYYE